MLVTDLDGTFVGDDEAMLRLWDALEPAGIGLVFATGRHLAGVEALYERLGTPLRADACICMVGTEVWLHRAGTYRRDATWDRRLADSWDRGAVESVIADVGGLVPQEPEWQTPVKCSWYVTGGGDVVDRVRAVLQAAGIAARVVYSGAEFLDVVPSNAGKGEAAVHLINQWGLDPGQVVAAGDSGNDLDMMQPELGFRSIVVGNAQPELRAGAGSHAYRAAAPCAAGITEGLRALGWLSVDEG